MIMIIINHGEKQKHKPWIKPDRTYHDTSTVSLCFTCLQRLQSLVRTDSCQSPGILDVQNRGHTCLGWNMAKPFELLQFEYNWTTQFHSILYVIFNGFVLLFGVSHLCSRNLHLEGSRLHPICIRKSGNPQSSEKNFRSKRTRSLGLMSQRVGCSTGSWKRISEAFHGQAAKSGDFHKWRIPKKYGFYWQIWYKWMISGLPLFQETSWNLVSLKAIKVCTNVTYTEHIWLVV